MKRNDKKLDHAVAREAERRAVKQARDEALRSAAPNVHQFIELIAIAGSLYDQTVVDADPDYLEKAHQAYMGAFHCQSLYDLGTFQFDELDARADEFDESGPDLSAIIRAMPNREALFAFAIARGTSVAHRVALFATTTSIENNTNITASVFKFGFPDGDERPVLCPYNLYIDATEHGAYIEKGTFAPTPEQQEMQSIQISDNLTQLTMILWSFAYWPREIEAATVKNPLATRTLRGTSKPMLPRYVRYLDLSRAVPAPAINHERGIGTGVERRGHKMRRHQRTLRFGKEVWVREHIRNGGPDPEAEPVVTVVKGIDQESTNNHADDPITVQSRRRKT